MCPTLARPSCGGLALPIGFAHPKLGSNTFEGALMRRRNSKGCGSIPSRSEKFGETRRSFFIFPLRKGDYAARNWLLLPWRGQEKQRQFRAEYSAVQKEV